MPLRRITLTIFSKPGLSGTSPFGYLKTYCVMRNDSEKTIKDFAPTELNIDETKLVKGGEEIVEEDIID